jgi:DNA invertase Pin-like site-specific DNA recombinase
VTQALYSRAIPLSCLFRVVYGWLVLIGVGFSTVLAQCHAHPEAPALFAAISPTALPARRRRSSTKTDPIAACYARFSSDLQDISTITQQQSGCREKAAANGHAIEAAYHFVDEAVSGTRLDRAGLNAMMGAARQGQFNVLYFSDLSRLARELVISLPMLKELVHVCGVRIISVTEGIDSDVQGWEFMAMIRAWQHEEYLKTLRANVLRGHQGALEAVGGRRLAVRPLRLSRHLSGRLTRNVLPIGRRPWRGACPFGR